MGFEQNRCVKALTVNKNDFDKAMEWLFNDNCNIFSYFTFILCLFYVYSFILVYCISIILCLFINIGYFILIFIILLFYINNLKLISYIYYHLLMIYSDGRFDRRTGGDRERGARGEHGLHVEAG